MKFICRLALKGQSSGGCQFKWLNKDRNWLFTIEDGKKMRTFRVENPPAEQIQSTSLAEGRVCTSLSWNLDSTVLALVIDKRQIYFWELKTNTFRQYKPSTRLPDAAGITKTRKGDIELVKWSKLTNRLAICFSSGQIMIYSFGADLAEKLIDNCDGVLRQVSCIETADDFDIFACITIISEILVMTFGGETKAYIQSRDLSILKASFSPTFIEPSRITSTSLDLGSEFLSQERLFNKQEYLVDQAASQNELAIWLAYKTSDNNILIKRIALGDSGLPETNKADLIYEASEGSVGHNINFYWLSSSRLLCCDSFGIIKVLQICESPSSLAPISLRFVCEASLNIIEDSSRLPSSKDDEASLELFRKFEMKHDCDQPTGQQISTNGERSYSLIAITSIHIFYYIMRHQSENGKSVFKFEVVDNHSLSTWSKASINHSLSLLKVSLSWDCSMLAVQLKNGNILIYRTRLPNYMVVSHNTKAAYLSNLTEITILNFATSNRSKQVTSVEDQPYSSDSTSNKEAELSLVSANDALTVNLKSFRPALIGIGPAHLAVALNNRVQLYLIASPGDESQLLDEAKLLDQHDYLSIAIAIRLSLHYAAIQFDDGRLKLHSIPMDTSDAKGIELEDERFFPDPDRFEQITSFTLTEQLLIYATRELNLMVFSLNTWSFLQSLDHSKTCPNPIGKMVANRRGNKVICLPLEESAQSKIHNLEQSVHLYELQSNSLLRLSTSELYKRLIVRGESNGIELSRRLQGEILDALWDTDERSVLLVEERQIHNLTVLQQTLSSIESSTLFEIVASAPKAPSYATLFVSDGVVSFQTPLGRMMNEVLATHDDELKLRQLEHEVNKLKEMLAVSHEPGSNGNEPEVETDQRGRDNSIEAEDKIAQLKVAYLRSILPIYSLGKCKQICQYLVSDEQLNIWPGMRRGATTCSLRLAPGEACPMPEALEATTKADPSSTLVWRQLARWAAFCLNLDFALAICREHGLASHARLLSQILGELRQRGLISRPTLALKLEDFFADDLQ